MDNRTLIAIVLSLFIIIGYQYFFAPSPHPPQPPTTQKQGEPGQETRKHEAPNPAVVVEPQPSGPEEAPAKEISVQNGLYYAVLSSKGGIIRRWELETYKDDKGNNVVLLDKPGVLPAAGLGRSSEFDLGDVDFSVRGGDLSLDDKSPSGSVIFEYAGDGFSVRRTYTFYAGTYKVDLTDEVSGFPEYWITLGTDFGIFDHTSGYSHVGPVLLTGTDLEELKPKKLTEPKIFKESLRWIAQEDKYFCAAIVPESAVSEARAWTYKDSPAVAFKGTTDVNKFYIYAGPKDHNRLAGLNLGLEHIVNFGFFSPIARPLFWVLKFFYSFIGNYGWSIILLTLVTRIPFIPIVSKGQRSMKKLQALQPKMNEVREKYKKDPQKMQQEMSDLYKRHKVNPVGGCLPMLLQIPVFFALYKVLLVAIELRGAPFMLWITDLSAKDPYYILPVVMGITMVVQQKMTPTTGDPKQAKLMMIMPVVFTFMFLNFASGLVLYWLVNNVLGIIQQIFVNKKADKEQAAAA